MWNKLRIALLISVTAFCFWLFDYFSQSVAKYPQILRDSCVRTMRARFPEKFEYTVFQDGRAAEKTIVDKNDPRFSRLYQYISGSPLVWRIDGNRYAPEHLFAADRLKLNVTANAVVAGVNMSSDRWVQLIRNEPRGTEFLWARQKEEGPR